MTGNLYVSVPFKQMFINCTFIFKEKNTRRANIWGLFLRNKNFIIYFTNWEREFWIEVKKMIIS